jgi:hypothetical protein
MHRNLLSWYEDDLVIAKDMVDNAAKLKNDQGRSGLCMCTCSPTVTSFMALNEYESLLWSLSIQEEVAIAPLAHDMSRDSEDASASVRVQWRSPAHVGGVTPRSMLPSWASLKDTSHDLDSEVYRCCMTELQLQAIVNQQGIEGTGESNLDMTIVNGVSVSVNGI